MIGCREFIVLLGALFAVSAPTASFGALDTISYQGQLREDGVFVDGTVSFKFAIVDVGGGEVTLWSNDSSSTAGSEPTTFLDLVVESGVFQVQLGSPPMNPLPEGFLLGALDPILRVWIKGMDDPGFQALGDQDLGASPFAFRAAVSDTSLTGGSTGGSSVWETNGADAYRLTGNVGIGTPSPEEVIHVVGNAKIDGSLNVSDDNGFPIRFTRPGLDPWKITQTFAGSGGLALFKDPGDVGSLWGLYLAQNGNVGVGTETPGARLDVAGNARVSRLDIGDGVNESLLHIHSTGESTISLERDGFDRWSLDVVAGGDSGLGFYNRTAERYSLFLDQDGQVGIGPSNTTPDAMLDVAGDIRTEVITITGGSDIAEGFDVRNPDDVRPGEVLVIDEARPGALRTTVEPYDKRVAGIVSGAGDVATGLTLNDEGTKASGDFPLAMVGRVWCWCDADANGPIVPGDRLTTSGTRGHAMKVSDDALAPGSVIGKAMTDLTTGKGLVLVLVNPQ